MKKYLVILGALLMVAGSAFAQGTVFNEDSCDISVSPAATLLLPYFSVDPAGETTLVTITNVSDIPAVAHFTVWTNLSYPVLDFNVFLTGYDVQGLSLTDVLVNGNLPSTGEPTTISPRGTRSLSNATGNPNANGGTFAGLGATQCGRDQGGTGAINPSLLAQVQSALTGGSYFDCGDEEVSIPTTTMVGYITIDVINQCAQNLPTSDIVDYFGTEMLHDNQLIGDYIRVDGAGGVSGASPLVHIKSVPANGAASDVDGVTAFDRTFYDRYLATDNIDAAHARSDYDRRQPLPAKFAARYIDSTALLFNTQFAIWRQGVTNIENTTCDAVNDNDTEYVEIVRFDERENPRTLIGGNCTVSPCDEADTFTLAETQIIGITNQRIPPDPSSDAGGWLYLNLANPDAVATYGATQAWVQVRMTAAGMFGVDFDAAYLSNGCSAFQGVTNLDATQTAKIGPHR